MKSGPVSTTRPWRAFGLAAAGTALIAVFLAYLDPHMAVDVANRLWSCF